VVLLRNCCSLSRQLLLVVSWSWLVVSQGLIILSWLLDVGHRSIQLLLLNLLLVDSLILLKLGDWNWNLALNGRCLYQRILDNRCNL